MIYAHLCDDDVLPCKTCNEFPSLVIEHINPSGQPKITIQLVCKPTLNSLGHGVYSVGQQIALGDLPFVAVLYLLSNLIDIWNRDCGGGLHYDIRRAPKG